MKWTIIAVGRIKERFYQDAIKEYLTRLSRYRAVEVVEVSEEKLAERFEKGLVVALTERGEKPSTEQLAIKLEALERSGASGISFVLGGPEGIEPELLRRSDWQLSLSALTFPYQLARLVLVEQLYRCETLRRREPYHKA